MTGRATRWALLLHPRRWRERYGAEVADLSDQLRGAGDVTRSGLALGLVGSAIREWARMARVTPRRAAVGAAVGAIAVGGSLTLAGHLNGPGSNPQRSATVGGPISVVHGRVRAPDFIPVLNKGKVAGYEPRAYLFASTPHQPQFNEVGPVYARDLHTLVGHEYPGIGFVALGASPSSVPCPPEETRSMVPGGSWVNSLIACPSTPETVPDVVGSSTPTAMGQLSSDDLTANIRYAHSPSLAAGHVLSITPAPGSRVQARTIVSVVSSLGPG